jgi:hypothetical protein
MGTGSGSGRPDLLAVNCIPSQDEQLASDQDVGLMEPGREVIPERMGHRDRQTCFDTQSGISSISRYRLLPSQGQYQ